MLAELERDLGPVLSVVSSRNWRNDPQTDAPVFSTSLNIRIRPKTGYWEGGLVAVRLRQRRCHPPLENQDRFPEAHEFHTLRVQPAPGLHYNTRMLRDLCNTWEKHGSGIIALHGQTGDIMLQGIEEARVQECFDAINQAGWDLGGAGPAMRTGTSCVGPARCEHACYDTLRFHYDVLRHFTGDIHRPSYNYKFKFKFSGCPN
jgi:sulfite reductase alpha subunit